MSNNSSYHDKSQSLSYFHAYNINEGDDRDEHDELQEHLSIHLTDKFLSQKSDLFREDDHVIFKVDAPVVNAILELIADVRILTSLFLRIVAIILLINIYALFGFSESFAPDIPYLVKKAG